MLLPLYWAGTPDPSTMETLAQKIGAPNLCASATTTNPSDATGPDGTEAGTFQPKEQTKPGTYFYYFCWAVIDDYV